MIPELVLFGVLLVLGGGTTCYRAWSAGKMAERIAAQPTTSIASLADGDCEITGRAQPVQAWRSPWSGRDVAYARYKIEEYVKHDKSSRWETRAEWEEPARFLVDDGSARALVVGAGLELDMPESWRLESAAGRSPPDAVVATMRARDIAFSTGRKMRFTETSLEAGAPVFVCGTAIAAKEAEPFGARVALMAQEGAPLLVTTRSEAEELKALGKRHRNGWMGGALLVLGGVALVAWALRATST